MLEQIYGKARHYKVGGVIPPKLAEKLAGIPRSPTSGIPNPYVPGEMRAFGGPDPMSGLLVGQTNPVTNEVVADPYHPTPQGGGIMGGLFGSFGGALREAIDSGIKSGNLPPPSSASIQGNDSIYWGGSTPGGSPSWAPSVGGGVDPYLPVAGAPGTPGAPGTGLGGSQPSPGMGSGGDGGGSFGSSNDNFNEDPSYGAHNAYNNWGGDLLGGLLGPVAGYAGDLAMGRNPITGGYMDHYSGPGSVTTDQHGIDNSSEQGEMLINQEFLDELPDSIADDGLFGGLFGGNDPKADEDLQFFTSREADEAWNDAVTEQDMAEADAINDFGFGSDEHFASIDASFDNLNTAGGSGDSSGDSGQSNASGESISNDTFDNSDNAGGWSFSDDSDGDGADGGGDGDGDGGE